MNLDEYQEQPKRSELDLKDENWWADTQKVASTDNSWYNWNIRNWGTKWETQTEDGCINDQTDESITVCFDTAWSPPIEFYSKMEDLGWSVKAYYFEPGMMFCGMYEDGDDDCLEVGKDEIPEELEEMFDISSWIDNDEETEEDDK